MGKGEEEAAIYRAMGKPSCPLSIDLPVWLFKVTCALALDLPTISHWFPQGNFGVTKPQSVVGTLRGGVDIAYVSTED